MIYHGLQRYGFHELAGLIAHYSHELVEKSGNYEYYDAETGEGCGLKSLLGMEHARSLYPLRRANRP